MQQITLKSIVKPKEKNPELDINWLCDSFGFMTGRDIEQITYKTITHLLKRCAEDEGVQSETIAEDLGISPARVNYHVRSLIETRFLYREKRLIFLRAGSLKSAVEELRKDANRILDELSIVAEEVDNALGFKNR